VSIALEGPKRADAVPGVLIVVEGIDGVGKTTLAARLADHLRSQGHPVLPVTRFMVTALTRLWQYLVKTDGVDQHDAALLAVADYYTGLAQSLQPALAVGEFVVADRYIYSHQVHYALRGVSLKQLRAWFAPALAADVVFYIDLPVEEALVRLKSQNKPDFWECGLDYRLGLSIGRAWYDFDDCRPPTEVLEAHFVAHQQVAQTLFRQVLPTKQTVILDGALDPEDLLARCITLLSKMVDAGSQTGSQPGDAAAKSLGEINHNRP
jgi:dTMP kinase